MSDCTLYLVSPPTLTPASFVPRLEEALASGTVKAFQLRLKDAQDSQILEAAQQLLPICQKRGVAFILNDRADLARTCGADGVHLGQDDMSIKEARAIVGSDCIIGATCHASRDLAMDAAQAGADYVAFGAFFPTTSKPQEKIEKWGVPTPEIVEIWSATTVIPCVAIGGMTPANCAPLVKAGADFIAVINYVWNHPAGSGAAVAEFAEVLLKA